MKRTKAKHSWPLRRLGDVARYINGAAFKPSDWTLDGLPIIRIQNLTDPAAPCNRYAGKLDEKFRVRDGDLLVSWSATLDVFRWERGQAWLNQHIFRVEEDTSLVSRDYLTLAIKHALAELQAQAHGTTMLHIKRGPFEETKIPVPPLAEQRRLVARIEALTSRLEQARQARQAALAETETVFQRALEIEFSDDATEDWNEHAADELFEIVGGQVSPHDAEFRDLPYLGPEHVESGTGRIIGERVSVAELKMKSGKYRFTSEHVVYSKIRPALRKVCTPEYPGLCSADMYALQPNVARISREFLKFLLLAPAFSDYAVEKSDRNAMPKINQTTLRAFRFRVPDRATQRRIVTRLDALSAKQTELRRLQTETEAELAAFTPALLAKAFRGEL